MILNVTCKVPAQSWNTVRKSKNYHRARRFTDQERMRCVKEQLIASESQVKCLKESVQKSNATLKSRCDRYTSFRESNEAKLHGLKKRIKSQITEHAKELSIAAVCHAKELEKEKNLRKKDERRFSRDMSKVDNQKVGQDRFGEKY